MKYSPRPVKRCILAGYKATPMVKNNQIASKGGQEDSGKFYREILFMYLVKPEQRIG
jgi:hypothetical protein